MTNKEKISELKSVLKDPFISACHDFLESSGDIKYNYDEYINNGCEGFESASEKIDHIDICDYDTCSALLTFLLREDYWAGGGTFEERIRSGDVEKILSRMITLLEQQN